MVKRGRSGIEGSGRKMSSGSARIAGQAARRRKKAASNPEVRHGLTLAETFEQQKATDEILRAIARSPTDTESVLQAVALNAARLCDAVDAQIYRIEGDKLQLAVSHGPIPIVIREETISRGWVTGRSIVDRRSVHIHDVAMASDKEFPIARAVWRELGHRTVLATPLLTSAGPIGAILIRRVEAKPFTDAQIRLLETFANQAAIALENARIISELETRNKELDDALEQQKAMAELLKAISSANGELGPVFKTLLHNAIRLCDAKFGVLFLHEDGKFVAAAMQGVGKQFRKYLQSGPHSLGSGTVTGRAVVAGKPVQIVDLKAEDELVDAEIRKATVELAGGRTIFSVPMMRDSELVGAITIYRREVKPFTDKQIQLVSHFADHAVIAMENARLLNDLRSSLLQQTATADVLKAITNTAFDLDAVFRILLQSAIDLCGAFGGHFLILSDGAFVPALQIGMPEKFDAYIRAHPTYPGTQSASGRVAQTGELVHIPDVLADPDYDLKSVQKIGGYRAVVGAPLIHENMVVGILMLARKEAKSFSESEIRLVRTFCDQAVIALQNARLLQELHDRNNEVTEALDQQTATADILKVISTSPTDAQPVFNAIARHAARLCRAQFCFVYRFDGEALHFVAHSGVDEATVALVSRVFPKPPGRGSIAQRAVLSGKIEQIADVNEDPEYERTDVSDIVHFRSLIGVPMMKGGRAIGAITLARAEVGFFSERQIELLQTFAEQAAIAIENARLFGELKNRTSDLAESLEQQTATSEVLQVISSSPGELQSVFEATLSNATRLCGAKFGNLWLREGEAFRIAAIHGGNPEYEEYLTNNPVVHPDPRSTLGQIIRTKEAIQIADVRAAPTFADQMRIATIKRAGARTLIAVPMLKNNEVIGSIGLYREEVRPFTVKQIELVSNFARQAVIAIDNSQLLNKLRESLQQQTATADVLKVISRSAFDLETVLLTLVESAVRLCNADQGTIARKKGDRFFRTVNFGLSMKFQKILKDQPVELQRGSATGRALLNGEIVHIPDVELDPDYTFLEAKTLGGMRTILAVPMLREGEAIGVFAITRTRVEPFSDEQIELASTFADQAAIAIENVRLFERAESRSRELASSLSDLRSTQDRLIQTEKLASLGQLTAGIAHEIKNPLNFVNNFASVSTELIDELLQEVHAISADGDAKASIDEIARMLSGNLAKIAEHGQRADSIVKNMLMHARQGSSEHRPVDINGIVEESLNLAYHGARAEKQGFSIEIERDLDPAAGEADIYPQDIIRVLLNMISNGFYAALKKSENSNDFRPRLKVSTRNTGDKVEIRVRDNGMGIHPEARKKLFSPFFTTKPVGEGTGLGLSISHDIVVKQHGGIIEVDSVPGEYCEFRIEIPVTQQTET
jgi:GAF domain-containing protein